MLNNYIKTLLLSTMVLVIGNNSNYCYSMEEQQVSTNYNNRIRYSDNNAPNINQMIKCANYEPIDINSQNSTYKNFINFCEKKDIHGIKGLVNNFITYGLYYTSICVIGDICIDDEDEDEHYDYYDHEKDTNELLKLSIKDLNLQKEASDNPALYNNGNYNKDRVENRQMIENSDIILPTYKSAIYQTTQIMNEVHKKLNPNKQTVSIRKNEEHKKLNPNKQIVSIEEVDNHNVMNVFYYFANHLVELSHDILYAINKKIDEYESNSEVYSFDNFRKYVEHEVIIPSYNAISKFYDQVFTNYINVNDIIFKNKTNNIHSLLNKVFFEINVFFYYSIEWGNFNLLDMFATLGTKLSQKIHEKFRIIAKELDNILDNIIEKFKSTKSYIIKAHTKKLEKIKSDYWNNIRYYGIKDRDINDLTNDQIIQDVKDMIRKHTFDYVKNTNKTIKNKFKEEIYYNSEFEVLGKYFVSLGKTKTDNDLEELFNSEQITFSKEIKEFNTEIHKLSSKLNSKLENMNYNITDPNYDYLSEMKESLEKYKKYNTKVKYFNNVQKI